MTKTSFVWLFLQAFSIYFIQDGIKHAREEEVVRIHRGNHTLSRDNATLHDKGLLVKKSKDGGASITVALVGSLNMIVALALFVCGVLNTPKLRMLLIVWMCWAVAVIILVCAIIIFYLTVAHSFLDGLRVFVIYGIGILLEVLCIWVVASYFKYLGIMAQGPAQGYRVVFNSRGAEPQQVFQEQPVVSSEPTSYSTSVHSVTSLEMVDIANGNTDKKTAI